MHCQKKTTPKISIRCTFETNLVLALSHGILEQKYVQSVNRALFSGKSGWPTQHAGLRLKAAVGPKPETGFRWTCGTGACLEKHQHQDWPWMSLCARACVSLHNVPVSHLVTLGTQMALQDSYSDRWICALVLSQVSLEVWHPCYTSNLFRTCFAAELCFFFGGGGALLWWSCMLVLVVCHIIFCFWLLCCFVDKVCFESVAAVVVHMCLFFFVDKLTKYVCYYCCVCCVHNC